MTERKICVRVQIEGAKKRRVWQAEELTMLCEWAADRMTGTSNSSEQKAKPGKSAAHCDGEGRFSGGW